jgi:hypothetical protein
MAGYNNDGVFTAALCENILIGLEQVTRPENNPMTRRSYLGYLEALRSPMNMAGVEIMPVQDGTKEKTVRIAYNQRVIENEVDTSESTDCTPPRYPDFLETEFEVDQFVQHEFGLNQREATKICLGGDNNGLINRFMLQAFDALNRKINRTILTTQTSNFGFNYGNSPGSAATKSINVLVGSTGAPLATGIQTLKQDYYELNQYEGTPLIVGQGNIMKYYDTIATGCCNQDGVDMGAYAAKYGAAFFLDTMVESVVGTNQFIVLAPGMLQFVQRNRYVSYNAGQMGTAFNTTVTDPRTGMTYDMKLDVDGCNEKYYIRISLNFGLWYQPTNTFHQDDPLYRTNGSLRYTAATT